MKKPNYSDFIDKETDHFTKYIISSEKNLNDFTSFLSEIYINGVSFHKTVNKKLLSFFDLSKISDVTTKIDQNMKFFYQTTLLFLNNINESLEKLNLIILTPLKEFKKSYEKENIKIQNQIENISEKFKNEKQKLIAYQKRYYLSIQNYNEYKKDAYIKKVNEQFSEKDQQNLNLVNSKYINDKQLYKDQLETANSIYETLNQSYNSYFQNFELNEGGKLEFLNNIFFMYSSNIHELSKALNEYCSQITSKFSGWTLEDDKKIIKNDFNYIKKCTNIPDKRFNKDLFLEYNNTSIAYVNNFYEKLENKKGFKFGGLFSSRDNDDTVNTSPYILTEEYQNKIMNKFFENLDSQNEIEINIITAINELVISDKNFPITFIKNYLNRHKEYYVRMLNEKNINYFSNILTTILLSNNLEKNNKDNLALSIINFGQRVYYILPKSDYQKIFLCGLLNNIPLFKSANFWNDVLKFILILKLQKVIQDTENEIEKLNKHRKIPSLIRYKTNYSLKKTNTNSTNTSKNDNGDNFFFDDINTNIQHDSKKVVPKKKKTKDNLGNNLNCQFAHLLHYESNFDELTPELKKKFISKSNEIFNSVILEYIPAFINFNFGLNNSIEFLVNVCNYYSVSNESINFYAIYLNNCSYSVKQYSKNTHYDLKNKIEDIKINFKDLHLQKNINSNTTKKIFNDNEKMIIIKNVSYFLTNKEKPNIFKLNKKINSKINKKIYKEMLNSADKKLGIIENLKMHISVWKILLKYENIKKNYPYKENLQKAVNIQYDHGGNSDFVIIDLDTNRTLFIDKLETKRQSLNNILKTIVLLNPDSNYCQGMNFVAAFILKICENEEESFYLLMGLFKNTSYKNIFLNDLADLKSYFNIFDRLLYLYLPTVYYLFNTNKIVPNYYLSTWFITLFTGLVSKDLKLGPFIKIFDNFIINGWKSIFNVSMEILRINEEILMTMKSESLMHYLTSKLGSEFLFSNDTHHSLFGKWNKNKISGKLLHNIANQLNQMKVMNEINSNNNM